MNREIKFRAWNGKMIDLKAVTPLALSDPFSMKGIFIPEMDDLVIMQFTGLKDRNDMEIYEGDIIQRQILPNTSDVGEVIFQNGCFMCAWGGDVNHDLLAMDKNGRPMWIEVLGNIYQNPELMPR